METKKSTALAATVAAVAAFALIIAATFSGAIFTTTSTSFTTGPTQTSSAQSQTSSQTSSQQSSTQQSSGQQGTLSILLTDPPCVPSGMTKVYVTYADLAVHASGAPNASGWTVMRASGSIELLGTVNISQTISSVKVSTGTYNMIRFNVTGAEVTYYGKNYTAFVQTSELTIPIVSGISVVASTPSATIIDISPTVINTGTQAIPQFIITSAADAYPVPSAAVTVQQQQEGSQMSLTGLSWWQTIAQASTAHLSVVSASLNQTYLNLKVTNTGGSSIHLYGVSNIGRTIYMSTLTQDSDKEGRTEFGLPIDDGFSKAASEERIQKAAAALRKNGFEVEVVSTAAEARSHVKSILPKDKAIFTARSETIRLSGLDDDINGSGDYVSIRQQMTKLDRATQMDEIKRLSATPDVVVGSVHAVTEDGRLVAGSASGSQLGPYSSGAGKAIFVVGSQKIVPDLETGLRRITNYSYPKEDARMREQYKMPSALLKILILNGDWPAARSTVVLIREPIGF